MNRCALLLTVAVALGSVAVAQDRLPAMPRYDRYVKLRNEIGGSVQRGQVPVRWGDDGKYAYFSRDGKNLRVDLATGVEIEAAAPAAETSGTRRPPARGGVERGRQFTVAESPDGSKRAIYKDHNVFLVEGQNETQISFEGDPTKRTKCGSASWVYGEELGVREAMWWSPDGRYLAYYFFDDSPVQDYYLALDVSKFQNRLDVEAYPKAGTDNPLVGLRIYDTQTKETLSPNLVFGPDGKEIGYYIYAVRWSPDGRELLFHRTNRKQNILEFCAINPATGAGRTIIREEWPTGWVENHPPITWLGEPAADQQFLWISERNGFRNIYLYDLTGKLHRPLTQHAFEVAGISRVDESRGEVWYRARSGERPGLFQLHRVGLNGQGETRLTNPSMSHTVDISPNGEGFVSVEQTTDTPPRTVLYNRDGKQVAVLAESNLAKFDELGLKRVERIQFKAADGTTDLYGVLHRPSDFDESKSYPLLVSVYAGPDSAGGEERFLTPDPVTEFGFLVASFDGRGTNGRGKAFKDAVYEKLGVVEIDDQAAGVKYLRERPYVDGSRVGIHGTSYGGYASAMALLRHPAVFQAAVASSSVTDWRHYDTIYTERYMGLPWENENKAGYDAGSAMTYAGNLKGRLLLFYGTADNNVHPANTYMLAQALTRARKSFDMMAGADVGHAGIGLDRTLEYFLENLVYGRAPNVLDRANDKRLRARAAQRARYALIKS
ncbi:MAG: DPP IV N-terminal domain-containing protein [Fimbriimonadaceae bacterium]